MPIFEIIVMNWSYLPTYQPTNQATNHPPTDYEVFRPSTACVLLRRNEHGWHRHSHDAPLLALPMCIIRAARSLQAHLAILVRTHNPGSRKRFYSLGRINHAQKCARSLRNLPAFY